MRSNYNNQRSNPYGNSGNNCAQGGGSSGGGGYGFGKLACPIILNHVHNMNLKEL